MYYAQAAATCHYLYHAEGGKHRELLLSFLLDYYSGRLAELDVARNVGTTSAKLGQAIAEHARAVVH